MEQACWQDHDSLAAEQAAFIASVLDGAPVLVDAAAGRRALAAALAVADGMAVRAGADERVRPDPAALGRTSAAASDGSPAGGRSVSSTVRKPGTLGFGCRGIGQQPAQSRRSVLGGVQSSWISSGTNSRSESRFSSEA